jgi:mono/diheme cytochrome c family protein
LARKNDSPMRVVVASGAGFGPASFEEVAMYIGKMVPRWAFLAAAFAVAWAWHSPAQDRSRPKVAPNAADPALVQRGAYLVNEVARCGDCHTPRDGRGKPDNMRRLQGAKMWFTPAVRPREWEGHAPDLTSSGRGGRWNEARWVKFLTTGGDADPPMPRYHLTADDARAVAAYLGSLPGRKGVGRERERGEGREKRKRQPRDRD